MRPHHFERLNSVFQKELSRIIQEENNLPSSVFLNISKINFDSKINLLRVEIDTFPEEEKTIVDEWFRENKSDIKFKLSKRIRNIKYFPEIEFYCH